MCEEVQRRGRRPMLWDGFDVEHASHLPKGVTVCVWDGRRGAPAGLRKHGLEIVNASFAPLYIVGGKQAFAGTVEEIHAWDSTRWRSPFPDHPYHKGYQLPVGVTERRPGAMLCVWELPADEILPALRARLPVFAEERLARGR
jgi:hypothetical protein